MYTIGDISRQFDLPISTIRYYDKKGLLPTITRKNGQRRFGQAEIDALHLIQCLKRSGLSIDEISAFMRMCKEGPVTYQSRLQVFLDQKKAVESEMAQLKKTEALIDYKIWYYTRALEEGSEEPVQEALKNGTLPEEVRKAYKLGFERSQLCVQSED